MIIYEFAGIESKHETASRTFDSKLGFSVLAGDRDKSLQFMGSTRMRNPYPDESKWEPDCPFV